MVVGAGVCGLTAAVRLAEAGIAVHLYARDFPPNTTSCAAGALFGPVLVDHRRMHEWCGKSWEAFGGLSRTPGTGVTLVGGFEASRLSPPPKYGWLEIVEANLFDVRVLLPDNREFVSGWGYRTFAIDTPVYCEYLLRRLRAAGGTVVQSEVYDLTAMVPPGGVVVNCTAGDPGGPLEDRSVQQKSGAVLVVDNPGIDYFFADADDAAELTYFMPHGADLILGGTLTSGAPMAPSDVDIKGILHRCGAIDPRLDGVSVRKVRVGARPFRHDVRLEAERRAGRCIIHNYGHGGGGVSLSWGCADEVLVTAEAILYAE